MDSDLLDVRPQQDVDEAIRDLQHKSFRVETEIDHTHEVKLEWLGRRSGESYVLLTSDGARCLSGKLRHAADLPRTQAFRESIFGTRGEELCVFVTATHPRVFLCLGDGYAASKFEDLGQFNQAVAIKLAIALEAAASAVDRGEAAFIE